MKKVFFLGMLSVGLFFSAKGYSQEVTRSNQLENQFRQTSQRMENDLRQTSDTLRSGINRFRNDLEHTRDTFKNRYDQQRTNVRNYGDSLNNKTRSDLRRDVNRVESWPDTLMQRTNSQRRFP